MRIKVAKSLTIAMTCVGIALGGLAVQAKPAEAVETPPIMLKIKSNDVLDTYKSFTTANYPQYNVEKYDQTYRLLTFQNSYSLTGVSPIYTEMGFSPQGNGMVGFITKYKCNYSTW